MRATNIGRKLTTTGFAKAKAVVRPLQRGSDKRGCKCAQADL
jgi:hypothetical protein